MTDEEMAEEWVRTKHNILKDCLSACVRTEHKNEIQAFLAGLKAGRPQWHKADVPTSPINKVVLGYIKHYNSKLFCLVGWNGKWWYDARTYNDEVKLIAWCEIPTFDKE